MKSLPLYFSGTTKALRYHPVPPNKNPLSASPSTVKSPSILQSWGKFSPLHEESSKSTPSAPEGSPLKNFQFWLNIVDLSPSFMNPTFTVSDSGICLVSAITKVGAKVKANAIAAPKAVPLLLNDCILISPLIKYTYKLFYLF